MINFGKKGEYAVKKILRAVRITVLWFLLLFLCTAFYIYISEDTPQNPVMTLISPKLNVYSAEKENVKILGRTHYENGVRYLSYSGSGIEFKCKGEYALINLIDDSGGRYLDGHKPRFAIYKNGIPVIDSIITEAEKTYHITLDGYNSETVIKIVKLSEAQYSAMGIGDIAVYGKEKIIPTDEKDIKIEFIGDSITCGYGIDEVNERGYFSTSTENFTKTYAHLAAENLNADYSAVCFSGFGVYSGYTSNGRINSQDIVPNYYDKSCFLYGGRDVLWNFSEFQSNIVVINLGTNDASYCAKSHSGRQEFTRQYTDFIKQVRQYNPYAYILCILGDMNNSMYSCIEQAVSNYKNGTFDHNVSALTIEYKMGENDIVIDGHPGYWSNLCAANELSTKIAELVNAYNPQ